MEIIHSNPYRIAGILSNVSEKELQKQKAKIKAYSKVGKELSFDIDFPILDKAARTEQIIEKAFSSIEQNQDKVNNSLFWFLKTSPFDETAFTYLVNGDKEKAIEIWTKVTKNKEVNSKNFSAFNNIGTLKLISEHTEEIKEGVEAKIKLIESDYFENFVHSVADQTFTINNIKQSENLIDELLTQFKNQYSNSDTLGLFSKCNGSIKNYLSKKFTEEPIHNIESRIESAKRKRNECRDTYTIGFRLFNDSKKELTQLKSLLGATDLHYKMIADNLAKEVMQCGIDYFNEWKDDKDPSKESLKLLKYAKSIAVGTQTKDRVKENLSGIEEWALTAPIQNDLNVIKSKLTEIQKGSVTINLANSFISTCKPRLESIKHILGSEDELYLDISNAIASNALSGIIQVVNEAQKGLEYNSEKLHKLPGIIEKAIYLLNQIGTIKMHSQTMQRYIDNKLIIKGIDEQLSNVRRSNSSGGCYIATMAYGDYDHPQVLELRKFRDEFLCNYLFGRYFINLYYKTSPKLVRLLKSKEAINNLIRYVLDGFINQIRK